MKYIAKIALVSLASAFVLTACASNPAERDKATMEKAQGTVQETVGNMTNNTELKNKGRKNRLKGNLRDAKENAKDIINNN